MLKTTEISDLLNQLATLFEEALQAPDQTGVPNDAHGWGQFLDATKPHKQIGLYGTSAGVMVLALAQRGNDLTSTRAWKQLDIYWKARSTPSEYSYEKLLQTPRLAFLNLALRLSNIPDARMVASEVENELLRRQLPSGLWGNFWISESDHDPIPRLFASALALLSISLLKNDPTQQDPRLSGPADALEKAFMSKENLPTYQQAAIAAALLSTKVVPLQRNTMARLRQLALINSHALVEGGAYFYDYEYIDASDGSKKFDSDFFIVPPELILGISGFQYHSPSALRMLAEQIASRLGANIKSNSGGYLSPSEQRITSNNQAWAALFLSSVSRSSWHAYGLGWIPEKLRYELWRHRMDNRFTGRWLPFVSMVCVVVSSSLLQNADGPRRAFVAVAALIIGGLYGPKVVRRLFRGIQ